MCGIWGFFMKPNVSLTPSDLAMLYASFMTSKMRGPDKSIFIQPSNNSFLGFHRLAILDLSTKGDQPFVKESDKSIIYTVCNGEIYDYKSIISKYNLTSSIKSNSDCEVISALQNVISFESLLNVIKNCEFAGLILTLDKLNVTNITVKAFRDPFGVRPLFFGEDHLGFYFSSNLLGIPKTCQEAIQVPPGMYIELKINTKCEYAIFKYYNYEYPIIRSSLDSNQIYQDLYLQPILTKIKTALYTSVHSMLCSDRPLGALLSGGLDSSLITAIAAAALKMYDKRLYTFSIGLKNSTDEKFAKLVSEHCGTVHTHFLTSEQEFLDAIYVTVRNIASYDTTSVRASVGQYLICKKISETTNIKVLLIGDGSDEVTGGYKYFKNAPTPDDFHQECKRLVQDISYFDVLRADSGVASNGLEARVPFLQSSFVETYMSIDPRLRAPNKLYNNTEKWLLRKAFDNTDLLPKSVLWRPKEAFSDGVSGVEKSWYQIIQEKTNHLYTDEQLSVAQHIYTHMPPASKESLYYREIFNSYYGDKKSNVIPYFWLPKWCGDVKEPSARVLDVY